MLAGLALGSFAITVVGLWLLLARFDGLALDRPNERSLHARPVPRTGGIALFAGASVSLAFGLPAFWLPMVLALVLAAVSFADDLYGLATVARLSVHLLSAAIFVWYVLSPMHPVELALVGLGVAWMTNLYNFMDGSDGLAGGMAVVGFGAFALAAASSGHEPLLALSTALAAAALGFLLFNFPPARIFLGDVGSVPLGFLAGALGVLGWRDDLWPLWFPVLVFSPFIADASITLLRRLARREKVWQPHRDHYYQRLVRSGMGHRRTALIGYALMLSCSGAALLGREQRLAIQLAAIGMAAIILTGAALWIDARWRRHAAKEAA